MKYLFGILPFLWSLVTSDDILEVVGNSGVPAMHAAVLPDGRVMFLDKIENRSHLYLADGRRAYSSIFDPSTGWTKGLEVKTNPFCCGGAFLADGQLVSLGGNGVLLHDEPTIGDGFDGIRYLNFSSGQKAWSEPGNKMASKRYLNGLDQYEFVNNNPTYEMLNPAGVTSGVSIPMEILVKNQPYFMYPFVHLLKDGSLFVFVSRSAQTFNVASNAILTEFPTLPGMHRTYPNTGGSVMLPLRAESNWEAEIMICGGGDWQDIDSPCDSTCGRLKPFSDSTWSIIQMPQPRGMVEGLNLLDGSILWLNGVGVGAQGFGIADDPIYDLVVYHPRNNTWRTVATSHIPRLYHSVALLLADGRVLIAGSNPNEMPVWPTETIPDNQYFKYPTELRIEIFTPWYLQGDRVDRRPQVVELSPRLLSPGDNLTISFVPRVPSDEAQAVLYTGGFVTHCVHMGQQMYFLEILNSSTTDGITTIKVHIPAIKMAPGPYFIYVLSNDVPAIGEAVMVTKN